MTNIISIPSYLITGVSSHADTTVYACVDCQTVYQTCGSCEVCEGCESGGCQTTCEANCQTNCEAGCEGGCEVNCQSRCEDVCQSTCEINCESACQDNCQSTCQISCQTQEQLQPTLPDPTLDTTATIKTFNSISITINPVANAETYRARLNGGTEYGSYSRSFTFTSLTPNTQYYIEIKVSATGYNDSAWAGYYATTSIAETWLWTIEEVNAFNNNGLVTIITYERWNAFVDRIYEVSGNDWWTSSADGATLSYLATKMTSSDKVLTAERFNSVRYNIGSRISTGISRVYKDDDVYGSYFITLANKLNEWIQSI